MWIDGTIDDALEDLEDEKESQTILERATSDVGKTSQLVVVLILCINRLSLLFE